MQRVRATLADVWHFNTDNLTLSVVVKHNTIYEYNGARSLDQALLMVSKERVVRTSLLVEAGQTFAKDGFGDRSSQTRQTSGNLAVAADPKVLPKAEGTPENVPYVGSY